MLAPRCSGGGRRRSGPRARLAGSLAVCPPASSLGVRSRALSDPAVSDSRAPVSVFIGARAPRSRSEALFAKTLYHVWGMKPGRKTKPQAAAAEAGGRRLGAGGGGRGGGRERRAGGGARDRPGGPGSPGRLRGELVAPRARAQVREVARFLVALGLGTGGASRTP